MKKYFYLLLLPILMACEGEGFNNKNPNIPNYGFSIDINLNLPSYNSLKFAGNAVYLSEGGALGVYVFNTGSGFNAFDAACPNQPLGSCGAMLIDGINAVCECDSSEYSLYTGIAEGQTYRMKPYRVQVNGDNIRVYN